MSKGNLRALVATLALGLALVLAACGGSDDPSSGTTGSDATDTGTSTTAAAEVSDADLQATIKAALGTDVEPAELAPEIVDSLRVASQPVDKATEDKLFECLGTNTCETGRGDIVVGLAEPNGQVPFRKLLRAEMTLAALQDPRVAKIIFTDGRGDLQTSLSNFRSLISQKADVIVGNFDFGASMLPVARQAGRAGIAVVPYTQGIAGAKPGEDVSTNVLNDPCEFGANAAKAAIDSAPDKTNGTVAFYTGPPGNPYAAAWQPCAKKELAKAGWTVATNGTTNWTPQGEQQAASALIASGDNPDAIIYDYTPEALVKKYLDAGKQPPTMIAGAGDAGYVTSWLDAKKQGKEFKGYIGNSYQWLGRTAVDVGVAKAAGEDVPADVKTPGPVVPVDNVEDQYSPSLPPTALFNTLFPVEWVERILSS